MPDIAPIGGVPGITSLATPLLGALGGGIVTTFKYGSCAPKAPNSATFRSCWRHGFLPDLIPYFKGQPTSRQPGTLGWDFAFCKGAANGVTGAEGCHGDCDCTDSGANTAEAKAQGYPGCVCAPFAAAEGLVDGTFVDAGGRNLGPAVLKVDTPLIARVKGVFDSSGGGGPASGIRSLKTLGLVMVSFVGIGAAVFIARSA